MTKVEAMLADEVLGWQKTDDGEHALFGFKDQTGQEFALAVAKKDLANFLLLAIDAQSLVPLQRGLGEKSTKAVSVNWFELGRNRDTGNLTLSFFRHADGHISFDIDPGMARKLLETLQIALGGEATSSPSKGATH